MYYLIYKFIIKKPLPDFSENGARIRQTHFTVILTKHIINHNFIVAVEYGMPFNHQDGGGSLYINTGYLF